MADERREHELDLRGTPCPLSWVKARLRLETLAPGETLELILDEGDSVRSVPRSVRTEGHRILKATPRDGCVSLLIERGG